MEITIGIQHSQREISVETDLPLAQIKAQVADALAGKNLELTDAKGRVVVVASSALAFVEIGPEETRRVGFGSA